MRHPLHSICPYFAMFPETFVAKQLYAYTERDDWVFDPFSGRGTTVFESLLNNRNAAAIDINPVAACISGAKANPPEIDRVHARLNELELEFYGGERSHPSMSRFFHSCFHIDTLAQLVFVRQSLDWQSSQVDQFLAAVLLGCLHGESHKTPNCLSNRMPRTISTKPEYSLKWWATRGLHAPSRNTFEIARYWTNYRLSALRPQKTGRVLLGDARGASSFFNELQGKVRLIVTSPPYLDTTNYVEDQWLRLWFLGGPETPTYSRASDDRHTSLDRYWQFLREIWMGCSDLLDQEAVVVVRIGGRGIAKLELTESLRSSLEYGFKGKTVRALHSGFTSEIKNRQTNAFRPGSTTKRYEHDFVFVLN